MMAFGFKCNQPQLPMVDSKHSCQTVTLTGTSTGHPTSLGSFVFHPPQVPMVDSYSITWVYLIYIYINIYMKIFMIGKWFNITVIHHISGSFWVWAQGVRDDVAWQCHFSLDEPMARMISAHINHWYDICCWQFIHITKVDHNVMVLLNNNNILSKLIMLYLAFLINYVWSKLMPFHISKFKRNCCHFINDIFKCVFFRK